MVLRPGIGAGIDVKGLTRHHVGHRGATPRAPQGADIDHGIGIEGLAALRGLGQHVAVEVHDLRHRTAGIGRDRRVVDARAVGRNHEHLVLDGPRPPADFLDREFRTARLAGRVEDHFGTTQREAARDLR